MRRGAIAVALLIAAAQVPGLHAQGGGAEADRIADRLRDLDERLESIDQSNTRVLQASIAVAAVAVSATVIYAVQLERQIRSSNRQLALAKHDVAHRLRPALSWRMFGDGDLIKASGPGERPGGLSIRIINTGQVSAEDIAIHRSARIVGSGADPSPRTKRLGALGPGQSMEVLIPMSDEDLGSAMGGGLAYVEARFAYRDGGGNELGYMVAGYKSNAVSTLFGAADAAPAGDGAPATLGAGPPAGQRRPSRIQSAGSRARDLALSQEPRDGIGADEAERLRGECAAAIREDPGDPAAHRGMAAALRALGRHEAALGAIRRADGLCVADARTLKEMARILEKLGRHNEAVGALGRILSDSNDDLCAYRGMARLHALHGAYGAAYAEWVRITVRDPRYETHMGLASVCMVLRQYSNAIGAFGDAIDKRPDDAYAHAQKGIAQLSYGHHGEAADTLARAIELGCGTADVHANRAHALYGAGRGTEAAAELDRAVGADPDNQKAHMDRGILMLEMGRLAEARESFAEARRLDPSMLVPGAGEGRRG